MPSDRFSRIRFDLLLLILLVGSLGAPLVGPLRESLQQVLGISRLALGLGVFVMGVAAGLLGLLSVVLLRGRWTRVRFIRNGGMLMVLGMLLMAVFRPAPGISAVGLACGWFLVLLGGTAAGLSNATIIDTLPHAPHKGVILLHGANALGKVLAPLLVLIVGATLSVNAAIFCCLLLIVTVRMLRWPRPGIDRLDTCEARELTPNLEVRHAEASTVFFWLAALQFTFIAGAEAGVTSILGSLTTALRPSPFPSLSQTAWAAAVLILLQIGIAAGRFLFVGLSGRFREPAILALCLPFVVFAVPAALAVTPWVYAPACFLLGLAFSATWPAFFALATRRIRERRSSFTMASRLFSLAGVNGGILLASAIGNSDRNLPLAVIISAGTILVFAGYLVATPWGWKARQAALDQ